MKKMLIIIAVVSALGAVGALASTMWSDRGERQIVDVANRLQVPADWRLASENVVPSRLICLGGNQCPSLSRKWQVPGEFSAAELEQLVKSAGWGLTPEQPCRLTTSGDQANPCVLAGQVDGYAVQIYHLPPSSVEASGSAEVRLFVNP